MFVFGVFKILDQKSDNSFQRYILASLKILHVFSIKCLGPGATTFSASAYKSHPDCNKKRPCVYLEIID